jgi:DUF1365 family protein
MKETILQNVYIICLEILSTSSDEDSLRLMSPTEWELFSHRPDDGNEFSKSLFQKKLQTLDTV